MTYPGHRHLDPELVTNSPNLNLIKPPLSGYKSILYLFLQMYL